MIASYQQSDQVLRNPDFPEITYEFKVRKESNLTPAQMATSFQFPLVTEQRNFIPNAPKIHPSANLNELFTTMDTYSKVPCVCSKTIMQTYADKNNF